MITSINKFPDEILSQTMSYLENRDRAVFGSLNKRLYRLSKQIASSNREAGVERCLRCATQFPNIYKSEPIQGMTSPERPQTMPKVIGDHLVILPHPSLVQPNILQIINLKTKARLSFTVDTHIEACEITNHPEPALIIATRQQGVKMLTLRTLLDPAQRSICFTDLPHVASPTLPEERLTLAPNLLDEEAMDGDLHEQDYSPVMCAQGKFVALGYDRHLEIIDLKENKRNTLLFQNARRISIQGQNLIAVSKDECVICRLDLPLTELLRVHRFIPQEPSFKFAAICAPKVVIAYRKPFHTRGKGVIIGIIHDLETKKKAPLIDTDRHPANYEYVLCAIVGIGNYIFGASEHLIRWKHTGEDCQNASLMGIGPGDRIHTMEKVGGHIFYATSSSRMMGTKLKKPYMDILMDSPQSLDSQLDLQSTCAPLAHIQGPYLIVERMIRDLQREIDVFNLDPV